jgi:hypothetical protein
MINGPMIVLCHVLMLIDENFSADLLAKDGTESIGDIEDSKLFKS